MKLTREEALIRDALSQIETPAYDIEMTERNYVLAVGKIYTNRNDKDYLCKGLREPGCYIMERTTDGWTLEAHIITMYEDGTIEWDYSTGGHWPKRGEA